MIHLRSILSFSLVAVAGLVGCDNTADKQRQADQAQAAADQKRAAAEEEARQKVAEAQNAAQQAVTKAQQQADEKQNAALASLTKEQMDRLAKVNGAIDDLNGKINDLATSSNAETVPSRKAEDHQMAIELSAHLEALRADAAAITAATPMTWPSVEQHIDKDLDDYRSSARTAAIVIKTSPR
jgi:hypothetical protein